MFWMLINLAGSVLRFLLDYFIALNTYLRVGWWVGVWLSILWIEETPPTCRIAAPLEQAEKLGNGAETTRPPGYGYDAFVMPSPLEWNR
jgi:hypothetical protein